jgi:hypothetical protein
LAIRTLGAILADWSKEILLHAMETDGPDFIEKECELALKNRSV